MRKDTAIFYPDAVMNLATELQVGLVTLRCASCNDSAGVAGLSQPQSAGTTGGHRSLIPMILRFRLTDSAIGYFVYFIIMLCVSY